MPTPLRKRERNGLSVEDAYSANALDECDMVVALGTNKGETFRPPCFELAESVNASAMTAARLCKLCDAAIAGLY